MPRNYLTTKSKVFNPPVLGLAKLTGYDKPVLVKVELVTNHLADIILPDGSRKTLFSSNQSEWVKPVQTAKITGYNAHSMSLGYIEGETLEEVTEQYLERMQSLPIGEIVYFGANVEVNNSFGLTQHLKPCIIESVLLAQGKHSLSDGAMLGTKELTGNIHEVLKAIKESMKQHLKLGDA